MRLFVRDERTAKAFSWFAFLPVPGAGAVVLWQLYTHFEPSAVASWPKWVFLTVFVLLIAHSVIKCEIGPALLGIAVAGVSLWFDGLQVGGLLIVESMLVLIGLGMAQGALWNLRERWGLACESVVSMAERNPRCSTCHARSFCPYQPGALADRYERIQVHAAPTEG